jgi:hypothetical protein
MPDPIMTPVVPEKHKVDWIAQARHGQEVYDRMGKKVGKVDAAYGGAGETVPAHTGVVVAPVASSMATQQAAPIVEAVAVPAKVPVFDDSLVTDDTFPKELLARLQHDGFIRIDAGLLKHHRYALRDQIADIEDDRVSLNVVADELIKH